MTRMPWMKGRLLPPHRGLMVAVRWRTGPGLRWGIYPMTGDWCPMVSRSGPEVGDER